MVSHCATQISEIATQMEYCCSSFCTLQQFMPFIDLATKYPKKPENCFASLEN